MDFTNLNKIGILNKIIQKISRYMRIKYFPTTKYPKKAAFRTIPLKATKK
jgi:hypothetical protein